jgi:hypothetical protein
MKNLGIVLALSAFVLLQGEGRARADETRRQEYPVVLEPRLRAESGTVTLTTSARLVFRADDEGLERTEPHDPEAPLAIAERVATGLLIELPVASLELTLPHEIFGHAARLTEFDATPRVELVLPPPYGFDGAKGDHVDATYGRPLTVDESTLVSLAGLRIQALQQRHLAFVTFRADELRRGDGILYAGNVGLYVGQILASGDVDQAADVRGIRRDDYRRPLLVGLPLELIDPVLLYSLYVGAYRYLVRGDRAAPYPEIHAGAWRISGTSRIVPVPWGVEHHLDVLVGNPLFNADVALRSGVGSGSWGIDLAIMDVAIIAPVLRAGFEGSLFAQPGLRTGAEMAQPPTGPPTFDPYSGALLVNGVGPSHVFGAAGYVRIEATHGGWFLGVRAGAKTAGLLDEHAIAAGSEVALLGGLSL